MQDLHSKEAVFSLEQSAKSVLKIEATWLGLQSSEFPEIPRVDGSVLLQDKRRTGEPALFGYPLGQGQLDLCMDIWQTVLF